MTCAAQAAEIFAGIARPSETLLDAGCGGGYYYHSFLKRNAKIEYYGLDYTPEMIDLACEEMCATTDLTEDRFILDSIHNLNQEFDNIICFNVLTNNPHYALPLDRLLACARKRILLRESLGNELVVRFTPDSYIDEDKRHIKVYHNTYPLEEVACFMREHGFSVTRIPDRRSGDKTEMVVDIPHQWTILLGERERGSC